MNKNNWKVIYFEESDTKCEIYDFINSLSNREQAKILSWISLLEEKGPNLPRPYADLLKDGIHELRIKLTGSQIRILYFFCYKYYIVLTHPFTKKTDKVPENEIKKSIEKRKIFLKNYDEKKLREVYNENI